MTNKEKRAKINFSIMALFAILPFFFVACSDDDDDNGASNHFMHDGDTYALSEGFKMYWGDGWGTGYNWDIYLISDGVEFDENEMDFSGSGHAMNLEMFSPVEDGIEEGTYTFDAMDEEDAFTFGTWSTIVLDYDMETDTGTELEAIGGEVEVSKSGSTYNISFNLTTEDEKTVTGNFSGPLPVIDFGWFKDDEVGKPSLRRN